MPAVPRGFPREREDEDEDEGGKKMKRGGEERRPTMTAMMRSDASRCAKIGRAHV